MSHIRSSATESHLSTIASSREPRSRGFSMMRDLMAPRDLTIARIAGAVGGRLVPPATDPAAAAVEAEVPAGYSIDSRTLSKGDLFFAIVGPNHDGHRFIQDAVTRGASAVVVSDAGALPDPKTRVPAIVVPDTLGA